MRQLLESIAFIHEKNVVHRDLKVSLYRIVEILGYV